MVDLTVVLYMSMSFVRKSHKKAPKFNKKQYVVNKLSTANITLAHSNNVNIRKNLNACLSDNCYI